jgi:tetratricopeptide (TPR) repeat protein
LSNINVNFDIPSWVTEGLTNQTYERVGGVIRDAKTKQVVAWLREIGSSTLSSKWMTVASVLTPSLSLLNLGLSTMGFVWILRRLDELEKCLQETQKVVAEINQKLDLEAYSNFRAALDLARNAFTMNKADNRQNSAMQAINRLLKVEHYYAGHTENLIQKNSEKASDYLALLFLIYIAEVRCYLELGETELAIRRFQEGAKILNDYTGKCIKLLLTPNPAIYLHPKLIGKTDLHRLTIILQWFDPTLDENAVFEAQRKNLFTIAQEAPRDQVDLTFAVAKNFFSSFNLDQAAQGLIDKLEIYDRLPNYMERMEAMIETYRRFEAYQSEVQAIAQLGMSFQEWLQLKPSETQPEGAELMYIMPSEPLELMTLH